MSSTNGVLAFFQSVHLANGDDNQPQFSRFFKLRDRIVIGDEIGTLEGIPIVAGQ